MSAARERPETGSPSWAGVEAAVRNEKQPETIGHLLSESAANFGPRVLHDFFEDGIRLTYDDLDRAAHRVAAVLQRSGVARGDRVGVMLPNVAFFPVAFCAIARLGAIMVAINNRYTAREIDYVSTDSGISVLVVDGALKELIETTETYARLGTKQLLLVDGDTLSNAEGELISLAAATQPLQGDADYLPPTIQRDDPVSILYTSGSTGFPKGCVHSHLYWLVLSQCESAVCPDSKRILLEAPYFYMMGPTATFAAMWRGRRVFTAKRPSLRNFMTWIDEYEIDSAWVTSLLLNDGLGSTDHKHDLPFAFTADIPGPRIADFEERYGISPRQCYGMTEIGFGTMVPWEDSEMASSGSIGIPGPLRECKLIDEHGADVVGVDTSGELCVRGIGMFSGYFNKPAVNAEVFLAGGWFRTGDIARRDDAGAYFFLGRAKDMIRRSSENIASREVEDALMRVSGVVEAAVVPVRDPRRGEEVKAYLVLRDGDNSETIPPQLIAGEVASSLATFKVPRYFEYRTELPRTASEKVSKPTLLAEKVDLRLDSYDSVDNIWR